MSVETAPGEGLEQMAGHGDGQAAAPLIWSPTLIGADTLPVAVVITDTFPPQSVT